MLSTIRHQAFPIIEFEQQRDKGDGQALGTLNGIILRHQLMMILKNRAYGDRIHDTVRCRRMDFNEFMYGFISLLCVSRTLLLRSVGSAYQPRPFFQYDVHSPLGRSACRVC